MKGKRASQTPVKPLLATFPPPTTWILNPKQLTGNNLKIKNRPQCPDLHQTRSHLFAPIQSIFYLPVKVRLSNSSTFLNASCELLKVAQNRLTENHD
jgi:hypothetical protein